MNEMKQLNFTHYKAKRGQCTAINLLNSPYYHTLAARVAHTGKCKKPRYFMNIDNCRYLYMPNVAILYQYYVYDF